MKRILNALAAVVIAAGLAVLPATAQVSPDTGATPDSPAPMAPYANPRHDDGGFDYGWLGLIGLAGLLGLFRKHDHREDIRPGVNPR